MLPEEQAAEVQYAAPAGICHAAVCRNKEINKIMYRNGTIQQEDLAVGHTTHFERRMCST